MIPALASFAARRALSAAAGGATAAAATTHSFSSSSSSSTPAARPPPHAGARPNAGLEDLSELDRILMRGMTFHGYHGVFPEENALGQKFVTDVTIYMDLRQAGLTDDLKDTLDYAAAYSAVRGVVESARGRPAAAPAARARAGGGGGGANNAGPNALVERVAQRCADALLAMDGRVRAVRVSVRKPHVAVEGVLSSMGVEVLRRRAAGGGGGGGGGGGEGAAAGSATTTEGMPQRRGRGRPRREERT